MSSAIAGVDALRGPSQGVRRGSAPQQVRALSLMLRSPLRVRRRRAVELLEFLDKGVVSGHRDLASLGE